MFCDHLGDPCGAKREDEKTYKTTPADEQAAKASDWQPCKQTAVKGLISSKAGAQEQACEAIAEVFSKCGQGGEHQLWAWKSRAREREVKLRGKREKRVEGNKNGAEMGEKRGRQTVIKEDTHFRQVRENEDAIYVRWEYDLQVLF